MKVFLEVFPMESPSASMLNCPTVSSTGPDAGELELAAAAVAIAAVCSLGVHFLGVALGLL